MHLMTFIEVAKPTLFERFVVARRAVGLLSRSSSCSTWSAPKTAHRVVGYFEEEAVISYTHYLAEIDEGRSANVPAPQIAKRLLEAARRRDAARRGDGGARRRGPPPRCQPWLRKRQGPARGGVRIALTTACSRVSSWPRRLRSVWGRTRPAQVLRSKPQLIIEDSMDTVSPELLRRFDIPGPRYTSYPTADRFVEAFAARTTRRPWRSGAPRPRRSRCRSTCTSRSASRCATTAPATRSSPGTTSGRRAYLRYLEREIGAARGAARRAASA